MSNILPMARSISLSDFSTSACSKPASEAQVPEMRASPVRGFPGREVPGQRTFEPTGIKVIQEMTMMVGVDAELGGFVV